MYNCFWKGVWGPAARHSRANNQARLLGSLLYFRCQYLGLGEGKHLSKGWLPLSPPTLATNGARAFIDRSGGNYMQKQHCQLWQLSSNWSSLVWQPSSNWSLLVWQPSSNWSLLVWQPSSNWSLLVWQPSSNWSSLVWQPSSHWSSLVWQSSSHWSSWLF